VGEAATLAWRGVGAGGRSSGAAIGGGGGGAGGEGGEMGSSARGGERKYNFFCGVHSK